MASIEACNLFDGAQRLRTALCYLILARVARILVFGFPFQDHVAQRVGRELLFALVSVAGLRDYDDTVVCGAWETRARLIDER